MDLSRYRTWIFDCDGVILDSNKAKTDAFRAAAAPYGDAAATALVDYHSRHGGISRFRKADHFFQGILGRTPEPGERDAFLERFATAARTALETCPEAPGIRDLVTSLPPGTVRLVVSGSAQDELRAVFAGRGLAPLFDAVFGSPDSKDTILARERAAGRILDPVLFVGDSRYDHEAAVRGGCDFLFVHALSEFEGWESHFADLAVPVFPHAAAVAEVLTVRAL